MIYGYARVSTAHQGRDGNSLEGQTKQLQEAGAASITAEVYTGTTTDRPKFTKLISELKPGDTLMVTKLDRFARSVKEGIATIEELSQRNITVHILNMGVIDSTPMGKLTRTVFLAFAEFERDMIVQRTQEGRAIARQKPDYREGRKPIEYDKTLFQQLVDMIDSGATTVTEAARTLGVSRRTWYNIIKKQTA